ncbi:ATP-binding cassette subfamily C member 4 [Acropora cervicornis]|uniref:ATP-binding cassette subfamily C member 4 n=1 Tax=Acropora cervicornis TaxID=6130 RepID=A0AAD9PYL8_ACRCE|nr:ATP-binding cassette subfamily C member 4 [Acropora cervicornis]
MSVLFLCCFVPYFAGLSTASAKLRLHTAAESDRCISLMNQVVSGIRAVKTHAWEGEYREKIKTSRRCEMHIIRKKSAVLSGVAGLEYTLAPMVTLVSVITLSPTGRPLTPVNVFMLILYINILRLSTCTFLAYGMMEAYDAYLRSLVMMLLMRNITLTDADITLTKSNREERKLNIEESGEVCSADHDEVEDKSFALCVSNLTYEQNNRDDEFILDDIQFTASPGSLTVITGPVGSRKSTLLSAIAGEVSDTSGTIYSQGSLVYVPQVAWIFFGTMGDNILFGYPYDEHNYAKTKEACALNEDIKQFPGGDQTIVGDRSAVLSGCQKAKVNLAHAVYAAGRPSDCCGLKLKNTSLKGASKSYWSKNSTKEKDEEVRRLSESGVRIVPLDSEAKGFDKSEEDLAVGVVSSKLYWDYLRSLKQFFLMYGMISLQRLRALSSQPRNADT